VKKLANRADAYNSDCYCIKALQLSIADQTVIACARAEYATKTPNHFETFTPAKRQPLPHPELLR